ncbi:hypothetical protein MCHI_000426 [Candidatus Magnetoovum chiemensis]|nr:hypothetical protein MCHI_000426 [Candidatus Magnetoovum chiemensis]
MHPNSGNGKYHIFFDGNSIGPNNFSHYSSFKNFKAGDIKRSSLTGIQDYEIVEDTDRYLAYLDTLSKNQKRQLEIVEKEIRLNEAIKKQEDRLSDEKLEYFIRLSKTDLKISRVRKKSIKEIAPGYYEINGKVMSILGDGSKAILIIDCGSITFDYEFNRDLHFNYALLPDIGSFVKGRIYLYASHEQWCYNHIYHNFLTEKEYNSYSRASYWSIEDVFYRGGPIDNRPIYKYYSYFLMAKYRKTVLGTYLKIDDIFYGLDRTNDNTLYDVPVAFSSVSGKWNFKRIDEANSQKHYDEYGRIPFYLVECTKLNDYKYEPQNGTQKKYRALYDLY